MGYFYGVLKIVYNYCILDYNHLYLIINKVQGRPSVNEGLTGKQAGENPARPRRCIPGLSG
jgi:hypothetical protein